MPRKVCLNAKLLLLPLAHFHKTPEGRRLVVRGKRKKLARPPWTARLAEMDAQPGVAQGRDPAPAGLWEPRGCGPGIEGWRGGAGEGSGCRPCAQGWAGWALGGAGEAQVACCQPAPLGGRQPSDPRSPPQARSRGAEAASGRRAQTLRPPGPRCAHSWERDGRLLRSETARLWAV